jgi:hypothetical protein
VLATLSADPASAHIVVRPDLIELGETVELQVELSRLRPGSPPETLELEGAGLEVLSTELEARVGAETRWRARVRATGSPGVVPIVLRAVYADGRSVEVDQSLTVVPESKEAGFPWPAAIAGVLLAVAAAAAALFLARRKA